MSRMEALGRWRGGAARVLCALLGLALLCAPIPALAANERAGDSDGTPQAGTPAADPMEPDEPDWREEAPPPAAEPEPQEPANPESDLEAGPESNPETESEPEPVFQPAAAPEQGAHPCDSLAELRRLLAEHPGETIQLTADIEYSGYLGLEASRPTTVLTGDYCIRVLTGSLWVSGDMEWVGESGPVLEIAGNGTAQANDAVLRVVATGENGVAVRVSGTGWLTGLDVEAGEPGGVGVSGAGAVNIVLSRVTGERAAVDFDGDVLLDCSQVSHPVDGARTIARRVAEWATVDGYLSNLRRYGFWMEAGGSFALPDQLSFLLYPIDENDSVSGRELLSRTVSVTWSEVDIDLSTPGQYSALATPRWPYPWADLVFMEPTAIPVTVVEPGTTALIGANYLGYNYVWLRVMGPVDPDDHTLYYSDDGGESWTDIQELSDTEYDSEAFVLNLFHYYIIYRLPFDRDYLFCLETGGVRTNIMEYPMGLAYWDIGGDRDGSDRDGEEVLPPVSGTDGNNNTGGNSPGGRTASGTAANVPVFAGFAAEEDEGSPVELPDAEEEPLSAPTGPPAAEPAGAADESISHSYPEGARRYDADELAGLAAANPQRLVFLSGGLRAALPTAALLEAVDGEAFAILLEPESGGFVIRLFAGPRELADLGGETFLVEYPAAGADRAEVLGPDGAPVPVELADGVLRCTLTQTGRYTVQCEREPQPAGTQAQPADIPLPDPMPHPAAEGGGFPWPAALVGTACAGTGGFAFTRKRRRGRTDA